MNLFKNKKFEVKMVDDSTPFSAWEKTILSNPETKVTDKLLEQSGQIANDFVTRTAVTVGMVYTGIRVVNTICKIAEIAAKAKIK